MKLKKIIIMALCLSLVMTCGVFLAACNKGGGNGDNNKTQIRDDTKWFSEEELAKKGLSALPAPTGLSGDMSSDLYWYNNGYSFHQACPDEDTFTQNAEAYLNYFKSKYDGRFGAINAFSLEKYSPSTNEYYYKILKKTDLADYFSDNPCPTYTFYYVTDTTLEEGYFKADAVWTFTVRLDDGKLKIFIENAGKTRNGVYTNHYRMV
jgi:hypothetical protein